MFLSVLIDLYILIINNITAKKAAIAENQLSNWFTHMGAVSPATM